MAKQFMMIVSDMEDAVTYDLDTASDVAGRIREEWKLVGSMAYNHVKHCWIVCILGLDGSAIGYLGKTRK